MKTLVSILLAFCLSSTLFSQNQSILGKWKTIDDASGKAKSIVEIFEKSGKIYGKIHDILDPAKRNNPCAKCEGEDHNKPIVGLTIIKGLQKDGNEYNSGTITDPNSGKTYKCVIRLEEKDKLYVHGYIGISVIGRTQYWQRINNE